MPLEYFEPELDVSMFYTHSTIQCEQKHKTHKKPHPTDPCHYKKKHETCEEKGICHQISTFPSKVYNYILCQD
jgi:hypothetical protein